MILVTVGTHEQPFDRLIKAIDDLKADGTLTEDVIIQTGFSTYIPQHCEWKKLFPYPEMVRLVHEARIVISHGGPSSFIMPLQIGKLPIVVPRMKKYGEHVNDHQVKFCREVALRDGNILLVEDETKLGACIADHGAIVAERETKVSSNNERFVENFRKITDELFRN